LIVVKQEDKEQIKMMNTPTGRLMKCFLRDLYMVIFLFFVNPFNNDKTMLCWLLYIRGIIKSSDIFLILIVFLL